MANEVSLSNIKEKLVEVANAIDAGDWALAQRKLASASALLVGLPAQVGFENSYARYENKIKDLREQIREAEQSTKRVSGKSRISRTHMGYGR